MPIAGSYGILTKECLRKRISPVYNVTESEISMDETTKNPPVAESCDVLVCGGGFGGIAAALSAARLGKRVVLLEKQYILGGLGTAGLVTIYLPLCDGVGHQVSFGLAEELLRLSISMGAEAEYPDNWLDADDKSRRTKDDQRFRVQYNPWLFAILAEQELVRAGVKILYGCSVVDTWMQGSRIQSVMVESISGRQEICVRTVVDATGDACVAHLAGAPTEIHEQGNILAAWYYSLGCDGYRLNMLGFSDVPSEDRVGQEAPPPLLNRRFGGLDCAEVSEMVQLSHASTLNDIRKKRRQDPSLVPTSIASIPQLRMTRRLRGEYTLDESEMHKHFADSVGMVSDWRKRGPVYEVPFSTLYSSKVRNLIMAGRCTSVTDDMWDIMRVIPCCAVTGQAAGTAAALADDFTAIDILQLQETLKNNRVVLHEQDLRD